VGGKTSGAPARRDLRPGILRALAAAISLADITIRTRSLTFARLRLLGKRTPPRTSGRFRFPFGTVRYVDAPSLIGQYYEIFVERGYEVNGLPHAPTIIDCGGNIGMSALWFGRRYPGARITVFEADPLLAELLAENVRVLRSPPIEVRHAAVGDRDGQVTFESDAADGGHVRDGGGISVPAVRLSRYIEAPVDILKVDIEGSEFALLSDLCVTGKIDLVKHIVCEVHTGGTTERQLAELWSALLGAGFQLSLKSAHAAPHLPGQPEPTPFAALASGKSLLQLYAWRP